MNKARASSDSVCSANIPSLLLIILMGMERFSLDQKRIRNCVSTLLHKQAQKFLEKDLMLRPAIFQPFTGEQVSVWGMAHIAE